MYKINVGPLCFARPVTPRHASFYFRCQIDVYGLMYLFCCVHAACGRFFMHARPLFQIHYPAPSNGHRANFLSLALFLSHSRLRPNNNKITSVSRLTPLNNSDGIVRPVNQSLCNPPNLFMRALRFKWRTVGDEFFN